MKLMIRFNFLLKFKTIERSVKNANTFSKFQTNVLYCYNISMEKFGDYSRFDWIYVILCYVFFLLIINEVVSERFPLTDLELCLDLLLNHSES